MDAEIVEKREHHLSVLKKNSIDRPEDNFEMESAIVPVDDVGAPTSGKTKAKDLKKEDDTDEDEDEGEDALNEDINITENFKALQGEVIEVDLKRNDFGFGIALAGHANRNRMGTFICGLHPQGSAFESGVFKIGDELLKVRNLNGIEGARSALFRNPSSLA